MTRKVGILIVRTIVGLLVIVAVLLMPTVVACTNNKIIHDETDGVDSMCCCPHTVICLQPFDDFTQKEAQTLKSDLIKHFKEQAGCEYEIRILPNKHLTTDLMNDAKTRYRASKIIRSLMKDRKEGTTVIGLTHKDISTSIHDVNDYGVMGLSFRPGTACVVSTYRVKPRNMLWKVAMHEFYHAFLGKPHCQSGDEHCIMQDAKGKNPIKRETRLCKHCKEQLW